MQRASGVVGVIMCVCVGVLEVNTYFCVCNICVNELCVKVTGCEVGVCGVCVPVCEAEDMSGWMTFGQMAYIIFIVHMSIHRNPIRMHPFCLGLYFRN